MDRSGGHQEGLDEGDVTEQVVHALRRIIRAIDLHSRALVHRYGLTQPQLAVLKELHRHGGVSTGRLTRALHLSQATMSGILDRLARRSLIRRERSDEDKRRVLVFLTPAGGEMLSEAPPLLQENFIREFDKLADWEQTQILSSLQRVVAMMEKDRLRSAEMLPGAAGGEKRPGAAQQRFSSPGHGDRWDES